ncbi:MAG: hypothetical protein JWQ96_898 [Segetibacter sp.]|nr:hypothetical protein [Segetibacter sp.]
MKNAINIVCAAIGVVFFVACQKEFTITDPDNTNPRVDSSMKAGIINVVSNGIYKKDSALGVNNTLVASLKVAKTGTYRIYSDTVQGFHFSTSVTFSDTSTKQVIVQGVGKPEKSGTIPFTLRFDTSRFAFTISVQEASVPIGGGVISGTLASQQEVLGVIGTLREVMVYDASGFIKEIRSQHYPDRKISYNNSKTISTIEYWYTNGNGIGQFRGNVNSFRYDAKGNVIGIDDVDTVTNLPRYPEMEFEYNSDNTLKTKRKFSNGNNHTTYSYLYTAGNLTGILEGSDTVFITYDTRVNNFKTMAPQFYFLDIMNTFSNANLGEIFFYSKNLPTAVGKTPFAVSTTASGKPFEIKYDADVWFRYAYN